MGVGPLPVRTIWSASSPRITERSSGSSPSWSPAKGRHSIAGDLADHLTTELVRHSVAEEIYMYPPARKSLPGGDQVAAHEIAEHAEVERTLKDLEGVDATDSTVDDLVGKVIADIRHHVQDEEQQLLPRLQKACGTDELLELGRIVVRAKASAPTRPHPSAPDKPPANMILGPEVGMIDKLRDALSGRDRG
jgi:hemerythrin superfamily protein